MTSSMEFDIMSISVNKLSFLLSKEWLISWPLVVASMLFEAWPGDFKIHYITGRENRQLPDIADICSILDCGLFWKKSIKLLLIRTKVHLIWSQKAYLRNRIQVKWPFNFLCEALFVKGVCTCNDGFQSLFIMTHKRVKVGFKGLKTDFNLLRQFNLSKNQKS